ncbi:unnamed protein product [Sphagnum jensenii]
MFVSWWTYAAVQLFYGDGESTWIIPSYIPDQGEDFPRLYHHQKEVPYMYYLDDQDVPRYRAHYHRLRPQFQSPRRIYQDLPPPYTETRYKAPGVAAATHYRPSVVEMIVPMCCTKCEEKVKESLLEMEGVEQVKTDQYNHRVTVTGFVDPIRVLKRVKKIKRGSDFMPWRMHYQHSPYEGVKSYPQYPQSSQVHITPQYYPDNSEAYYAHELNYPYSFYAPSYHHHY